MNPRQLAVKALGEFRRTNDFAGALEDIHATTDIENRDRNLAENIYTGVIQNLYYIDFCISSLYKGKIGSLHPVLLDIIRSCVYQIVFLDRIPASAAVNESVKIAKKRVNPGAAGIVNAIGRKLASMAPDFPRPDYTDTVKRLSTQYSHSQWFTAYLIDRCGIEQAEQFLLLDNQKPGITLQVNKLCKVPASAIAESLNSIDGVKAFGAVDGCYTCETLTDSIREMLVDGKLFVQDVSAKLAVCAADPQQGDSILDACAAPGGKSFSSYISMCGSGQFFAYDISEKRMAVMRDNCRRLSMNDIHTGYADASSSTYPDVPSCDIVFVDAPCSGFGTIRKKPEIRYKEQETIAHLPELQYEILSNCSKKVKQGGKLIYSTCTVLNDENEAVVQRFLKEHSEFMPEDFTLPSAFGNSTDGMKTIWPWMGETDGFFISVMRRI